jgi:hypothetical protein
MPAPKEIEQLWHCDGHELLLRINRAELEILAISCPHAEEDEGACKNRKGECAVIAHISRYGMDCNGGVSPAMEHLVLCWTIIGDIDDVDSSQLWFMPTSDDVFQAWIIANNEETEISDENDA